jgi:hypothetical protein
MWGAVIIVAPPADILDVREQVIEGEGVARTLDCLYALLEPSGRIGRIISVGVHQDEPVPYGLDISFRDLSRIPVRSGVHVGREDH